MLQTFSLEGPVQNLVEEVLDLGSMNNPPESVYYFIFLTFVTCVPFAEAR